MAVYPDASVIMSGQACAYVVFASKQPCVLYRRPGNAVNIFMRLMVTKFKRPPVEECHAVGEGACLRPGTRCGVGEGADSVKIA
jgi:hypothetical protein